MRLVHSFDGADITDPPPLAFQAFAGWLAEKKPQVLKLRCQPPEIDEDADPLWPADLWAADAWEIGEGPALSLSPDESARLASTNRDQLSRYLADSVAYFITYTQHAEMEKAYAREIARILFADQDGGAA